MAAGGPGYGDFLKAAFHRRSRMPLLGELPLNYLGLAAFGVLGLANPGFWFLGAALELGYLATLSSSRRFQELVRGERLLAAKESWQARLDRTLARLSPASRQRYQRLLAQCRDILGIAEVLEEDSLVATRDLKSGGLNQMLWIFVRLLASREVLAENLARVERAAVEREVEALMARLAAAEPESTLHRSLSGTLEIQRRRLDNLARAAESLAVVDAELERIQQQVALLREESAVTGKAEALSGRLDAVSSAFGETNRWMEQNARIFGELGADPLGSAPPDLPDLPDLPTAEVAEK